MAEPSTPQRGIVLYPAPVLLTKAAPVERIDAWVKALVDDMIRIMRDLDGAGIAAPQVGEGVRIFVVEERKAEDGEPAEPLGVYINPSLHAPEGGVEPMEEGCLSLPEIRATIRRPPTITIRAMGLDGKVFERTDSGMLARIWQHEFDHLEGTLITDRMSSLDKMAAKKALKSLKDDYEATHPAQATSKPGESTPAKPTGFFRRFAKR